MMRLNLRLVGVVLLALSLASGCLVACGTDEPDCKPNQRLEDSKCVDPVEQPASEKKAEPAKEPVREASVESTGPEEPNASVEEPTVAEPAQEKKSEPVVVDEPSSQDASEPTLEVGPEVGPEPEPVVEETPEPTGPVPTVQITAPKEGAVVKEASVEIEVDAKVASGSQIDRVELYIDGKKWSDAQQTPYRFSIGKGRLDDGTHTLKAVAVTTGYQRASDEIKITTAANGPTIKFLKPAPSASVTGAFSIVVEVKSALKLKANGVSLTVDGKPVAWTKTTPNYEAQFDPKSIGYDSVPITVKAIDQYDLINTKQIVVVHDPKPGPKKAGEACDNKIEKERCVAGHSCLNITGKAICYANCDTSKQSNPCQTTNCQTHQCQPSHMGTRRGVCFPVGPAPGCLHYECTKTQRCNSGMICVGAGTTSTTRRWCMATCTPGSVLLGCKGRGFRCVPVGTSGVCIEICRQPCKKDGDCGDNQTCNNGVCGGPYCQKYNAPCRSVQAGSATFNACI